MISLTGFSHMAFIFVGLEEHCMKHPLLDQLHTVIYLCLTCNEIVKIPFSTVCHKFQTSQFRIFQLTTLWSQNFHWPFISGLLMFLHTLFVCVQLKCGLILIDVDISTQGMVHTIQVLTFQLAMDRCYHERTALIYNTTFLSL